MPSHLLVCGERLGFDVVAELHRDAVVLDGAEDLVDLADLLLVLEVDRGVEVRDVGDDALAHQVVLARVREVSQF